MHKIDDFTAAQLLGRCQEMCSDLAALPYTSGSLREIKETGIRERLDRMLADLGLTAASLSLDPDREGK